MIYEVFERDLVGPELIAANLRCMLDRPLARRSSTRWRRSSIGACARPA